jgi:hypothetical protein
MAIIISKNGKNAQRLNQSTFDKEDYLQQYIHDNPNAVPVYEIDEDIRLLILAREFSTTSGPIDALGIDQRGNIYLVETKLYKNPDKRTVVAQVLDYGASLWRSSIDFTEFTNQLDKHVIKQFNVPLSEQIQSFFSLDADATSALLDNMQSNLNNGIFKFVVLMDNLERRLKDLILFINRNSQFDVYAVELEYYKHEDFEIIIPKLYGAEVKKEVTGSKQSQHTWTLEEFWSALENSISKEQFAAIQPFVQFMLSKSSGQSLGKGTGVASVGIRFKEIGDKSLVTVYSNGNMSVNFGNIPETKDKERLWELGRQYLEKVWSQPKFQHENLQNTYPSLSTADNASNLRAIFKEFLDK